MFQLIREFACKQGEQIYRGHFYATSVMYRGNQAESTCNQVTPDTLNRRNPAVPDTQAARTGTYSQPNNNGTNTGLFN